VCKFSIILIEGKAILSNYQFKLTSIIVPTFETIKGCRIRDLVLALVYIQLKNDSIFIAPELKPFVHRYLRINIPILFICLAMGPQVKAQTTALIPDSATSTKLLPNRPATYYVEQGVKYFRTMQSSVPNRVRPNYGAKVIRWEWHPWLLLTGYTRHNLINTDILLKLYKTDYDTIDCRYFDREPFCRCHVMFNYSGKRFPIYEEFTFNPTGEITFIEAWSDYPGYIPMDKKDYWAQGPGVKRISTRVPGLGNATGLINPKAPWMKNAANKDKDLADLLYRIQHPIVAYMHELKTQKNEIAKVMYNGKSEQYPYWP